MYGGCVYMYENITYAELKTLPREQADAWKG